MQRSLKDYLQDQGNRNIRCSKDATREAFKVELITNGKQWMEMIQSCNLSSHTYDERTAEQLANVIIQHYYPLFVALKTKCNAICHNSMIQEYPFGLSPATLDKLNSVVFVQHSAIEAVLIYGSRAKGNYRTGSDIAFTIKGDEISFAELMQIEDQIDDLMLPYTVDLSQYSQLEKLA